MIRAFICRWALTVGLCFLPTSNSNAQPNAITHSFLACGGATYIRDGDGKILWQFPMGSRDGWVLSSGNALLAVSANKQFPGGGVVEVTRDGKTVFEFKGTQKEVNTVQAVGNDRIMLTEAGAKP